MTPKIPRAAAGRGALGSTPIRPGAVIGAPSPQLSHLLAPQPRGGCHRVPKAWDRPPAWVVPPKKGAILSQPHGLGYKQWPQQPGCPCGCPQALGWLVCARVCV